MCALVSSLRILVGVFVNQIFFVIISAYDIFFVILVAIINTRVLGAVLFKFSLLIGTELVLRSLVRRLLMLLPDTSIG